MSTLSDADRALVEAMAFDADAVSREGYRLVRDLLVARGFIHRGVPVEAWDDGYLDRWEAWNEALASGLRWNGFRRMALTTAQRAELRRYVRDASGDVEA
jgi:hypothetical protein